MTCLRRRRLLRAESAGASGGAWACARCAQWLFFFQAEDGIRDYKVTGVQTCALPIYRVRLSGVRGHARPATLKVNVCREQGWLAEGEISYAGPRAEARARLAADVLRERSEERPCRERV